MSNVIEIARENWNTPAPISARSATFSRASATNGACWCSSALSEADGGRLRFSELMRAVDGISQRMLTTTLRHLERDGILTRQVYPEVPPRVEYTLTARGQGLLVPVKALIAWILNEWPEIAKSRREYDQKIRPSSPA